MDQKLQRYLPVSFSSPLFFAHTAKQREPAAELFPAELDPAPMLVAGRLITPGGRVRSKTAFVAVIWPVSLILTLAVPDVAIF